MERNSRFLGIKSFFRSYGNVWPTSKLDRKLRLLDQSGIPACYVGFFDGIYDALYRNPIDNAVDSVNLLIGKGIKLDEIDIEDKKQGENIQNQTGYTVGYLKGVYEVMFLERPGLFNKRPSTEKNILEK